MKKAIACLFALLSIALLAGCGSGEVNQPATTTPAATGAVVPVTPESAATMDTATLMPIATQTVTPAPTPMETTLSKDEAKEILQAWVDSHPFQLGSELEPESDDHVVDGIEYYRFYLGIRRLGVAKILVDKITGELFNLTSPYATVGFAPIDEW